MRLALLFLAATQLFAQPSPKVVMISLDGFPAYALDDPRLPIPTLRMLMRNGASAPMIPVNPTVTWPNHTALVTGVTSDRHGLLANGTIERTGAWPPVKVSPMIPQPQMVHAPTLYDAARKAGLTTAQVDWVAIHQAPGINWAFSEWAEAGGPLESEMIANGYLTTSELSDFSRANIFYRDQLWTRAGEYLIKYHQPNLLLLHLLSLDSTHHEYGPNTPASRAAIAFLDSCVGRLVEAVRAAGLANDTTFFIVSDHGFKAFTKEVRPNLALKAVGLDSKVWVLSEGGTAYVYFDDPQLAAPTRRALESVEGIDRMIDPAGYPAFGLPTPERDPQFGKLLLTAKDGYSFSGATGGPVTAAVPQQRGSHGYLATDPAMRAIFIAAGRGVTPGTRLDTVRNTDVAATIARLLGLSGIPGTPIALR